MSDQTRWYEQSNQGERVIANQGGPQYNTSGGPQNAGSGTQNNSFGGPQNNSNGTQNNNMGGGRQFVNNGGTFHINDQMRDQFNDGIKALAHREYAQVVARFREFLSTANPAKGFSSQEDRVQCARAHVYIVLGLLNGSRPSYYSSEVIREIEGHLAQARKLEPGTPARAMADVVLAIVKEDFYDERQIPTGPPRAAELRDGLAGLAPPDLEDLARHMAPAEGRTWREMTMLAASHGYEAHAVAAEEMPRIIAPDRRVKVIKYFTKTPDPVSPAWHLMLFGGAALLVIVALVSRSLFSLLLVAAAAWVAKKGYNQYKKYRQFLREWAAAEPKPAEPELDQWLREDTEEITRRGAHKLQVRLDDDLNQSDLITPPIVVVGVPDLRQTRNGWLAMKIGSDLQLRADHYTVLVLFLTRQVVSTYHCVLDFATGDLLATEETRQHHWANIVGVSSVSAPVSRTEEDITKLVLVGAREKMSISSRHQFTVSIVNGDTLEVTTKFGGQSFESSGGKVAWQGNDHALSIIQGEVRARNAR